MDVLALSYQYPSVANIKGGIFVQKLNRRLVENGVDLQVVAPVPYVLKPLGSVCEWGLYRDINRERTIDGVEVEHPRYLALPRVGSRVVEGALMAASMAPIYVSQARRADVIHAHTAIPDGVVGRVLAAITGTPLVVTTRGSDLRVPIGNRVGRVTLRWVYRGSAAIVFVSESLKGHAGEVLPAGLAGQIVYDGVGQAEVRPPANAPDERPFKVLSVGALKKYKGHQHTIEGIHRVREEGKDVTLTIIGGGSQYRDELECLVSRKELSDVVDLLGRIPHEEVMQTMAEADLFVLPSSREGFGIVYVEAMAHGCPAVGCTGEGPEDVVDAGETGHLIRRGDVEALTDSLREFYSRPQLVERMGAAARERALTDFTSEQTANAYLELYRSVAN